MGKLLSFKLCLGKVKMGHQTIDGFNIIFLSKIVPNTVIQIIS